MITYITITFLFLFSLIYFIKYIKLKKVIKSIYEPIRKGYYKVQIVAYVDNSNFVTTVFVNEIERYKSGESKIEIYDIEYGISELKVSHEKIKGRIVDTFVSIVKTSDINWLELEDDLMQERKNKINKLIKNIKSK